MNGRALLAAVLLAAACGKGSAPGTSATGEDVPAAVQEGKAQFEAGQLDAALASLQQAPDHPESLYWQGRVWAKRAESAPLPTPEPPPSPAPRGWQPPPPPELKPEELKAAELFERAIAGRPDHGPAHLALAELLAPHAAHRHDLTEAAVEAAKRKRGAAASPLPALPIDASADRVIREYQLALQADPSSSAAVDSLMRFGRRVRRFDAAEAAFREQLKRTKEAQSVDTLIRYGDFLATEKKDLAAAVEQYRQALIWRPDDDATRTKLADIYIAMGTEYYLARQYAVAEESFKEAARWITDRSSPQARTVQDYQNRLKSFRK